MPVPAALIAAASGMAALMPLEWSAACPPRSSPDEIVVCANRDPAPSPYRSPLPALRNFGRRGTASVSAERNALLGPDAGTIGSCSALGASGMFGCNFRQFKDSVNQAAGSRDPRGRVYERSK